MKTTSRERKKMELEAQLEVKWGEKSGKEGSGGLEREKQR